MSARWAFGPFEFSPESLELFRGGMQVPLRNQAGRLLALLIENRGHVVTREEIRRHLWGDTVVGFDKSLNFCVLQLRRTLDDNPRSPRYIQTMPRLGYRFIAAVRDPTGSPPPRSRTLWIGAAAGVIIGLLLLSGLLWTARQAEPRSSARTPYLEGRYLLDSGKGPGAVERSLLFLDRAVEQDPHHAPAWAALAEAHLRLYMRGKGPPDRARSAADRALELDHGLAIAHLRRGDVASVVDWDFQRSEHHYQTALHLAPELAEAHLHYSTSLLIMGRVQEALHHVDRALGIQPASALLAGDAGWSYLYAGRHRTAASLCQRALELEPMMSHAHECLLVAQRALGDPRSAAGHARWLLSRRGGTEAQLEAFDSSSPADAMELFDRLNLAWLESSRGDASPRRSVELALAYAAAGDVEASMAALEEAYQARSHYLIFRIRDPRFIPLRSESRFNELLDGLRVGAGESAI